MEEYPLFIVHTVDCYDLDSTELKYTDYLILNYVPRFIPFRRQNMMITTTVISNEQLEKERIGIITSGDKRAMIYSKFRFLLSQIHAWYNTIYNRVQQTKTTLWSYWALYRNSLFYIASQCSIKIFQDQNFTVRNTSLETNLRIDNDITTCCFIDSDIEKDDPNVTWHQ